MGEEIAGLEALLLTFQEEINAAERTLSSSVFRETGSSAVQLASATNDSFSSAKDKLPTEIPGEVKDLISCVASLLGSTGLRDVFRESGHDPNLASVLAPSSSALPPSLASRIRKDDDFTRAKLSGPPLPSSVGYIGPTPGPRSDAMPPYRVLRSREETGRSKAEESGRVTAKEPATEQHYTDDEPLRAPGAANGRVSEGLVLSSPSVRAIPFTKDPRTIHNRAEQASMSTLSSPKRVTRPLAETQSPGTRSPRTTRAHELRINHLRAQRQKREEYLKALWHRRRTASPTSARPQRVVQGPLSTRQGSGAGSQRLEAPLPSSDQRDSESGGSLHNTPHMQAEEARQHSDHDKDDGRGSHAQDSTGIKEGDGGVVGPSREQPTDSEILEALENTVVEDGAENDENKSDTEMMTRKPKQARAQEDSDDALVHEDLSGRIPEREVESVTEEGREREEDEGSEEKERAVEELRDKVADEDVVEEGVSVQVSVVKATKEGGVALVHKPIPSPSSPPSPLRSSHVLGGMRSPAKKRQVSSPPQPRADRRRHQHPIVTSQSRLPIPFSRIQARRGSKDGSLGCSAHTETNRSVSGSYIDAHQRNQRPAKNPRKPHERPSTSSVDSSRRKQERIRGRGQMSSFSNYSHGRRGRDSDREDSRVSESEVKSMERDVEDQVPHPSFLTSFHTPRREDWNSSASVVSSITSSAASPLPSTTVHAPMTRLPRYRKTHESVPVDIPEPQVLEEPLLAVTHHPHRTSKSSPRRHSQDGATSGVAGRRPAKVSEEIVGSPSRVRREGERRKSWCGLRQGDGGTSEEEGGNVVWGLEELCQDEVGVGPAEQSSDGASPLTLRVALP